MNFHSLLSINVLRLHEITGTVASDRDGSQMDGAIFLPNFSEFIFAKPSVSGIIESVLWAFDNPATPKTSIFVKNSSYTPMLSWNTNNFEILIAWKFIRFTPEVPNSIDMTYF